MEDIDEFYPRPFAAIQARGRGPVLTCVPVQPSWNYQTGGLGSAARGVHDWHWRMLGAECRTALLIRRYRVCRASR